MTWTLGHHEPSASLLTTPNCEECLIHWMPPRDPDPLEQWVRRNFMKYNKDECKVLHWGRTNPQCQYRVGPTSSGAVPQIRTLLNPCGGLKLAGCQVPTKATESLPPLSWTSQENMTKVSWVEI